MSNVSYEEYSIPNGIYNALLVSHRKNLATDKKVLLAFKTEMQRNKWVTFFLAAALKLPNPHTSRVIFHAAKIKTSRPAQY